MRLRRTTTGVVAVALLACSGGHRALGGVIEFTDSLEWQAAVGGFTTIDFTGFPDGTPITDQYADLGVMFVGGNEHIFLNNSFPNDGAGLRSPFTDIVMEFDTPQRWIAVDFPGLMQFELFSGGKLIYTSSAFGIGGAGNFAGLLSTEPFDMVAVLDPSDQVVNIDDLFFGVPAPPTLALLALATLFSTRRRRAHIH